MTPLVINKTDWIFPVTSNTLKHRKATDIFLQFTPTLTPCPLIILTFPHARAGEA